MCFTHPESIQQKTLCTNVGNTDGFVCGGEGGLRSDEKGVGFNTLHVFYVGTM